ncbi:MAG TPA: YhjD/YihY/BrkB family envelope integrity protein [Solirubrobacterales bacterium]|nr:YhjD/YihY/BrkB family envelope integrity protein [Solirubrobacterales bacterium]
MSTAASVPETRGLEGDDAVEALRDVGVKQLVRDSFVRFRRADGFSHSRALAFQLVLTLLPALIAVVGFAHVLDQDSFSRVLESTFKDLAPGPAGQVLTQTIESGSGGGGVALFLGLAISIVSGATAMGQIERGANRIYGVERDRPSFAKYARATLLALSAGIATVGALVLVVAGSELGSALADNGWSDTLSTIWSIGRWPLGAALVVGAAALLFERSPNRSQPEPSWLAFGSGLSVLLWFGLTGLLAGYLEISKDFGETYGPLAGFIGLMLWALLTALALFAGLTVAAQLEAIRAGKPDPDDGSS